MRLGELGLTHRHGVRCAQAGSPERVASITHPAVASLVITQLAYDSREVLPGALFAAWRGLTSDGHDYAPDAARAGAQIILCERIPEGLPPETWCVTTADVRQTLAQMARHFYDVPDSHLVTVGITGTNGKTTCAILAAEVLAAAYGSAASVGTLGLRVRPSSLTPSRLPPLKALTTPESVDVARTLHFLREEHVAAVALEASSQALDQHRLDGTLFDVAMLTNITRDHLDYHGTLEAYRDAKARLGRERLKAHGRLVINMDDPVAASLADSMSFRVTARAGSRAEVRIVSSETGRGGMRLCAETPRGSLILETPWVGQFNIENIAVVLGMAEVLGLPHEAIKRGVAQSPQVPGRLERVQSAGARPGLPQVFVDYAHTPDALENALRAVRALAPSRVFVVFGCGGNRDSGKRARMGRVAAELADQIIVTNDNPRNESPATIAAAIVEGIRGAAKHAEIVLDRAQAIAQAIAQAGPGDLVLIAGKGHETYQIIGDSLQSFDDRAVAASVLGTLGHRDVKEDSL